MLDTDFSDIDWSVLWTPKRICSSLHLACNTQVLHRMRHGSKSSLVRKVFRVFKFNEKIKLSLRRSSSIFYISKCADFFFKQQIYTTLQTSAKIYLCCRAVYGSEFLPMNKRGTLLAAFTVVRLLKNLPSLNQHFCCTHEKTCPLSANYFHLKVLTSSKFTRKFAEQFCDGHSAAYLKNTHCSVR